MDFFVIGVMVSRIMLFRNFLVLPRFLSAGERAELTEHPHYNHICAFQKKAVTKRTGTVE